MDRKSQADKRNRRVRYAWGEGQTHRQRRKFSHQQDPPSIGNPADSRKVTHRWPLDLCTAQLQPPRWPATMSNLRVTQAGSEKISNADDGYAKANTPRNAVTPPQIIRLPQDQVESNIPTISVLLRSTAAAFTEHRKGTEIRNSK